MRFGSQPRDLKIVYGIHLEARIRLQDFSIILLQAK